MWKQFAAIGCVGFMLAGCVESPSEPPSLTGNTAGEGAVEVEPADNAITPREVGPSTNGADSDSPVTGDDVEREVGEAVDATTEFAAQKKDEYVERMQKQIDELDGKIAKLEEQAADVSEDARAEWEEQLQTLKEKRRVAGEKFDELKSSSQDAWKDFQAGVDDAWAKLTEAFDTAAENFE